MTTRTTVARFGAFFVHERCECGFHSRGCSFITLHTWSDDFCPGYETFSGFSHRARNIFQIPLPGYETFLPKSFLGVRNIFVIYQQFGGLLGILGSIIISMEEFIGVLEILESTITVAIWKSL